PLLDNLSCLRARLQPCRMGSMAKTTLTAEVRQSFALSLAAATIIETLIASPLPAQTAVPNQPSQPAPPPGKVLFSRDANSPEAQPTVSPNPAAPTAAPAQSGPLAVTGAERSS